MVGPLSKKIHLAKKKLWPKYIQKKDDVDIFGSSGDPSQNANFWDFEAQKKNTSHTRFFLKSRRGP